MHILHTLALRFALVGYPSKIYKNYLTNYLRTLFSSTFIHLNQLWLLMESYWDANVALEIQSERSIILYRLLILYVVSLAFAKFACHIRENRPIDFAFNK